MTTEVHARHILVETEQEADDILKEIEGGKDFGEIAHAKSKCPSKEQGGSLGWFGKNAMVKEFEDQAFSMKPGEVAKVKTQFGWHVIKVEEVK
ncbi:MAG: peptidylprolyl isomerase [Candidatus Woesearchaeota archaeon]|jgi:peptidyl-prolyl cis-trans isomerase C|nr:peptidylprolyl isomerase [Candidatus Woesearchaeota archaeon]MDP7181660.1 peptidylprolyl isomerase [Candidatus Woesearchaeota archaeon]MDP7198749.1 peptidylprolyl isomerase [Candidatus Woesearchaeota archaeon]MDP7467251.1 peptidylprolyl isomerase [Candidatus Woesearchaeota archaeon]MDP7647414.1 peptidylprolyl isomerase [Candidatus Woesearchaeota archaeon]|tara:strand:- start:294 stop:572 length:279 start_codon:yes stop_codon:yes gene_type:complete